MGEIRIVAGELRRRKIRVFAGTHVRPTSDRVREALFDILGPEVEGRRVLDAFAGTGALGLEALSRGAEFVTFVESDTAVAALLRENIDRLGVQARSGVVVLRAEVVLRGALPASPFDLVLADPPYSDPVRERFLAALAKSSHLAVGARVVLEADARADEPIRRVEALTLERSARYGRSRLDFYRREPRDSGLSG